MTIILITIIVILITILLIQRWHLRIYKRSAERSTTEMWKALNKESETRSKLEQIIDQNNIKE